MEQQVVQGVQETSFFLFAYESIKYILSKNIEQKEQKTQSPQQNVKHFNEIKLGK